MHAKGLPVNPQWIQKQVSALDSGLHPLSAGTPEKSIFDILLNCELQNTQVFQPQSLSLNSDAADSILKGTYLFQVLGMVNIAHDAYTRVEKSVPINSISIS